MFKPQAMVFDMDGVLVDGEKVWLDVYEEGEFLTSIAPDWSPEHKQDLIGLSVPALHRLLCDRFGVTLSLEHFRQYYNEVGREIYAERTVLMPKVQKTLSGLRQRDIPLGLASNSPREWIDITLERFELKPCFAAVVSGEEVARGKPAPDIYLEVVGRLGKRPRFCWAVEDTDIGVKVAKQAGLYTIGYRSEHNHNHEQELDHADQILYDLSALLTGTSNRSKK
ncbi:MAG: HAD family hydrolase [Candidatus Bipolaricaulia bacterium]